MVEMIKARADRGVVKVTVTDDSADTLLAEAGLMLLELVRHLSEKLNSTPDECYAVITAVAARYMVHGSCAAPENRSGLALEREPVGEP